MLGDITDFRVWNTARTAQQIRDNMFRRLKGNEAGLVTYFAMEENSGTLIFDSVSGYVGSLTAGATWDTSSPMAVTIGSDSVRGLISRQAATLFRPPAIGRFDFSFDNYDGRYSPENANSPYYGLLRPNRGLRIQATYSGSTRSLFTGVIDLFDVAPPLSDRTVRIQASDRSKDLLKRRIDTPVFVSQNVGSLAVSILSAAAVASADMKVDSFNALNETVPYAWYQNYEVQRALQDLIQFGYYQVYVGADGKVNIRNRYVGLTASAVGSYVNDFWKLSYTLDDLTVINQPRITGTPRIVSTAVNTVAWMGEKPFVPASASIGFWLNYVDPTTQEKNTPAVSLSVTRSADFMMNTASDSTGTDLTATASAQVTFFGASAVCSVFNGSGQQGFLTKFQLRGYSAQRQPQLLQESKDSSSQVAYGVRPYALTSDFISGEQYMQDYAAHLLRIFKDPVPFVDVALKNVWPDNLDRELTDVIYLVESNAAIGSLYQVAGIDHEITLDRGLQHVTTLRCTSYNQGPWLVLDNATLGKLDSGRQLAF
jgi:hypothetical protein